ncbi:MAG: carboxyl transferase domain-containing protein [Planctomycetota bacterium]
MQEAVKRLNQWLSQVGSGGDEKYKIRHQERGKLLPRERIELLMDRDRYFLEIAPLAGFEVKENWLGAGIIGGIGVVSGTECVIWANEATVKGGAICELGVQKSMRLAEIARNNGLPTIQLIESAGADLPNQHKIFIPGGQGFREITQRSAKRIPTLSLVFGSSTAGGAYFPGMSDYVVMVRNQAKVFLAGPPLVKMASGEISDEESLGGALMHSTLSGVSDYLAENEPHALQLGREIIQSLHWSKKGPTPHAPVREPLYPSEELLGIASADIKVPFEAREVITRLVDGSDFHEFKPHYGTTLVTGFAQIHGYPVGILANNGILFSESSNKGAQFIALCNQIHRPLIFLQNITGFMVGKHYEEGGIIKNGAKLINAVSNSTVPAITIMIGASFGAGNYGMCGRAYQPRFLFTWPNHRIAVMGAEQLAGVMEIVKREAAMKANISLDEAELSATREKILKQIQYESDPYFATARLWDDGIIDPRDTRSVLGIALSICHQQPIEGTMAYGVFRH